MCYVPLVQGLLIFYFTANRNTIAECHLLSSKSAILLQNPHCLSSCDTIYTPICLSLPSVWYWTQPLRYANYKQWCPICFWHHKTLVAGHIKLPPGCFNWIEWCPAFHVGVISISSTWDATKWLGKCYIIGAYFFGDFCYVEIWRLNKHPYIVPTYFLYVLFKKINVFKYKYNQLTIFSPVAYQISQTFLSGLLRTLTE